MKTFHPKHTLTQIAATLSLAFSLTLLGAGCGKPSEPGPEDNDGGTFQKMDRNFAHLVTAFQQGSPARVPWAGYYWPYVDGGIATTEFSKATGPFRRLRRGDSPTAKYDRAQGAHGSSRNGPAEKWELANHGKKVEGVQSWWGHCNGWSAAAALFPEPTSGKRVNEVEFDVADIKALLSEVAMEVNADFFGSRDVREDVVPDQLFLVLTHYMGRDRRQVLLDRNTGPEVWNQPLAGYRFDAPKPEDYLGADPANPNSGVYRMNATVTLWWVRDDVHPGVVSTDKLVEFDFRNSDSVESRTLKMELWLDGPVEFDGDGTIRSSGDLIVAHESEEDEAPAVGGAWRMGNANPNNAWPDYLWVPVETTPSTGYANPNLDVNWIQKNLISRP